MSLKSEINFSANLLKLLSPSEKSTIFAPSIILNALAMTYSGSEGITAEEMENLIGKGESRAQIIEYYSNFVEYCKKLDNGFHSSEAFTLKKQILYKLLLSNRLFITSKITPSSKWKEIMDSKFDGQFGEVDFLNAEETAKKINKFVSEKTEGHIDKIINESDISDETVLFIINALCFQGFWEQPFDDPKLQKFYFCNDSSREIEMIYHTAHMERWNLTEGEKWKCLGIPFETRQSFLHILLPNKMEDFEEIIQNFDFSLVQKCIENKPVGRVLATIPAFQIDSDFDLESMFKNMGLKNAFKDEHGIREMFKDDIAYISKVIHKAGIKVDQFGTFGYAAGAMGFELQCCQKDQYFVADHPFIFFVTLVSDKNPQNMKSILLMGTFC